MGRSEEFPLLKLYGLKASPILGDGNCLFNTLSDQIYGHQGRHGEIRANVILHMRANEDWYKPFIDVSPGGGQRRNPPRNPKRKNAGAAASSFLYTGPTQEQIDAAWESHLDRMSRDGTYGDNMEIRAFTKAYNTDVRIFSHNNTNYSVLAEEDGAERPVAYIAYHNWEHYSSIRNINGPATGLPNIQISDVTEEEAATAKAKLPKPPVIQDWMIEKVKGLLPEFTNDEIVRTALKNNGGDINKAASQLLDAQYYSSAPGTPGTLSQSGSSSIERDPDSDDEEIYGPNKRQNRRMSRSAKALRKGKRTGEAKLPPVLAPKLTKPDSEVSSQLSLKSPQPIEAPQPHAPQPKFHKLKDADNDFTPSDEEYRADNDTASEYATSSRAQSVARDTPPPSRPKVKIILNTKNSKKYSNSITTQPIATQPTDTQPTTTQPPSNPQGSKPKKKLVTAREQKDLKKTAQKQAAKERKRAQSQEVQEKDGPPASIKRHSPPMERVLSLGKLSMIQI